MDLANTKAVAIIANGIKNAAGETVTVEIPAGETYSTDDAVVASTLIEYGAKSNPVDVAAARQAHAERNREINSLSASASASEGKIIARQQATVDVATGGVDGGELKGSALDDAVKAANEAGAEISSSLKADDKRAALAKWQTTAGSSSRPSPDEYVVDESGELLLDDDGQPIARDSVELDESGAVVFDSDGKVVYKTANPDEGNA